MSFCYRPNIYDNAIKKLTGKYWKEYRRCENDTCYDINDSDGFYLNEIGKDGIQPYFDKDSRLSLLCLPFVAFSYIEDPVTGKFSCMIMYDRFPNFCFVDSMIADSNNFAVCTIGEDGRYKGILTFILDDSFITVKRQLPSMARYSTINTTTLYKYYYKSVTVPQEVWKILGYK